MLLRLVNAPHFVWLEMRGTYVRSYAPEVAADKGGSSFWRGNASLRRIDMRTQGKPGLWLGLLSCPSSKMRLTTKVRVSNGSGGSVSGDPQIEICGMQQGVTSLLRPARGSLYAS
jgi:hypothetical protein